MKDRLLIVCASRGRRERLLRMVNSVRRTSLLADVAVYEDEDDPQVTRVGNDEYIQVVGPQLGPCRSLNALVKRFPGHAAYGAATDDCTFETKDWDKWVLEQAHQYPVCAIAPYSDQPVPRMDFPWVTGKWVEAMGSFTGLGTYQAYWDVALQILGEQTCIRFARPDEFRIWHESVELADHAGMDMHDPKTFMFYLYHLNNDAQIVCVWLAHERQQAIERLRKAAQ